MKVIRLKEVFSLSLSYALAVEKGNVEDLMNTFSTLYPQYKQIAMTAVRQLEKKGEIKGRQARNIEIARSMIQDKEPIDKVIKWTGLNKEDIEKIIKG
jgi:predicted transposase/invertase (TIGR01784 family)